MGDSRDSVRSSAERRYVPFHARIPWKPETVANPTATGTPVQGFHSYSRFMSAPSNMPMELLAAVVVAATGVQQMQIQEFHQEVQDILMNQTADCVRYKEHIPSHCF